MSKNGTFLYYKKQDHAFNRQSSLGYIGEVLYRMRETGIKNAIFIMDNIPFHRVSEVKDAVEREGHVIKFLPRYSPFLNPIENMFSQWKTLVRAYAARDCEELLTCIDSTFLRITEENFASYYRHMLSFIQRCINKESILDG
jgi:transposase